MDKDKITAALHDIRLRIDRCLRNERSDRQMALEDVDELVSNLIDDVRRGRV